MPQIGACLPLWARRAGVFARWAEVRLRSAELRGRKAEFEEPNVPLKGAGAE
jgi:hypothetical protein